MFITEKQGFIMWQDYVITVVQAVFAVAIVPTIAHPTHKPPISSCVITTAGMGVLAVAYFSLSLWYSAALATVVTAEWFIVGVQRHRLNQTAVGSAVNLSLRQWRDIVLMRD